MSPQSRLTAGHLAELSLDQVDDTSTRDISTDDVAAEDITTEGATAANVATEGVAAESVTAEGVTADSVTSVALLNCLIREVADPSGRVRTVAGPALLIELPATGRVLRAGLRRHSPAEPRPTGQAAVSDGLGGWLSLTWRQIAELVDAELSVLAGRLPSTDPSVPTGSPISTESSASTGSPEPTGRVPTGSALVAEVAASHAFVRAVLDRRRSPQFAPRSAADADSAHAPTTVADSSSTRRTSALARYLASEQALVAGHRFHPAPKARSGALAEALRYAPEVHSAFRLHYLAVPEELVVDHETRPGAAAQFDVVPGLASAATQGLASTEEPAFGQEPAVAEEPAAPQQLDVIDLPAGYRLLPVHPWQHRILSRSSTFLAALATGRLIDLGELGDPVHPTSSVRTVTRDDGSGYLKLSLAVQITNCLRVNPAHELHAAVVVSRLLEPIRAELTDLFPGTVVLAEPAARTVNLGVPGEDLAEQLGAIAREGLRSHLPEGAAPLLAAALVEPAPIPAVTAALPAPTAGRDGLITWWDSYLKLLLPPVLHAFLAHGVVFEAHLQNVVIGLPGQGGADQDRPGLLVLRDLEGVKLLRPRHREVLAALPPKVRDHLGYSPEQGWNRVAYCLFVNHLSAVLATLADRDPGAERLLWYRLRAAIQRFQRDVGDAPQLRDVLAGLPLPAKTNLLTRWHQDADRDSGYQPLHLPFGTGSTPPDPDVHDCCAPSDTARQVGPSQRRRASGSRPKG